MNKNVLTISAVVLFHLTVVTVMLVQPGCKSDAAKSSPAQPAEAANITANATAAATPAAPELSQPTRPAPETLPAPVTVGSFTPTAEPLGSTPAVSAPSASASVASTTKTYAVKANDSFIKIARENGITVDELLAANPGMTRSTTLRVGKELTIPAHAAASTAPTAAATSPAEGTYKVAPGENLTVIARKLGTSISALKAANNLSNDTVHAGQMLKIPGAAAGAAAPAATAVAATPGASAEEYTVEPNDSPQLIARKTGVKLADLMALNKLTNESARNLKPGQKLKLPAKAGPAVTPTVTPASPAPAMPAPSLTPSPAPVTATPAPMSVSATPVTPAATGTERPPVAPVAQ